MKPWIVIPAYNESKKIGEVLDDLLSKKYKQIIVVDDGSTDNTLEVCRDKGVHVVRHVINRGQGAALQTGIDFALNQGAEIIITFDADGQFLVKEIEKVMKPVEKRKADIVLGSRFLGNAVNIPTLKKIVLKLGIFVVFVLYGIRITDSQSGFRALNRKAAQKIKITADRMDHAGEIFFEIKRNRLKYVEIPITVIYSEYSLQKGQSWSNSIDLGLNMLFRRLLK